jgi:F-type H+-transporting ATPase subunit a
VTVPFLGSVGGSGLPSLLLAAGNPLSHVEDRPLFDFGDPSSPLEQLGLQLAQYGITKQTVMFFVAGIFTLLFFWSYAFRAGKRPVPGRWGNFVELVIDLVRNQMVRPFIGQRGDRDGPVLATFFVYILISNLLGLVPFFDFLGHGGNTPTGNIKITAALAVCAFSTYHLLGIREQGLFAYIRNLFPHVPLYVVPIIVVVELMAHVVRPCALAIRLFANMLAGHTLVAAILGFTAVFTREFLVMGGAISVVSVAGVTALTFLELLVAVIQAFVFTFLTTVFLAGALHPEH